MLARVVTPPSKGLRHPRIIGVKKFGIRTLRKLKGMPGLGEAEEGVPVSNTVKVKCPRSKQRGLQITEVGALACYPNRPGS